MEDTYYYKSRLTSLIRGELSEQGKHPEAVRKYLQGKLNFFDALWEEKITLSLEEPDDVFLLNTLNILVSGSFAGGSYPTNVDTTFLVTLPKKINCAVFSRLSQNIFKFEVTETFLLPLLKNLLNQYGVCTTDNTMSASLYLNKCYDTKSFIEYIQSLGITFLE